MIEVTTETFETEVNQSVQPVLVDFWGPRCVPCLALMPLVEEIAAEHQGRLKVVKVNAQENRRLCIELRVLGLPAFLFYQRGQEIARLTREVTASALSGWVTDQLTQTQASNAIN